MREIKFRGRRKNSSEWVYGAFLAIPKLCSYIYDVQPDGQAVAYFRREDPDLRALAEALLACCEEDAHECGA